jgi:hypothetical protein
VSCFPIIEKAQFFAKLIHSIAELALIPNRRTRDEDQDRDERPLHRPGPPISDQLARAQPVDRSTFEQRVFGPSWFKVEPELDPLRSDLVLRI